MRIGTRGKAVVQPVSLPQVEPKRGESYLVRRLVCAPVSWRVSPGVLAVWAALASGLLFRFCVCVWSRRVLLALLRCLVSSSGSVSFPFLKRGHDPGHRPKDRSSGRYPQVRTIYLDVGPAIGYLFIHFPIISSCVSFSALPPRAFDPQAGVCERAFTCRAGSPWRLLLFTFLSSFLSAGSALKKTWIKSSIVAPIV